ncbi:hypothetical protein [Taklimakanibacter lacteus]|uniref:hypothetical protein n=1 Tax=Taklimakanibacter lacteus TaxID=2268456 RepID=UPI000E6677A3
MSSLRSFRVFAVVAIIAMILAVFAPFAAAPQAGGSENQSRQIAAQPRMMDCEMCPKADMALTGCPQMTCQMATAEMSIAHIVMSEKVRYATVAATRPSEWLTVPPVSPG